MKLIITGGAGFIGSTLIRKVLKYKEYKILNLDKLTYASNLNSIEDLNSNPNYKFIKCDICDYKLLEKIIGEFKPNKIIHLAAESHVDRSIDNSFSFIETNIIGTYNLLEIARKYYSRLSSLEKNKFIFHHVSTDEVYGSLNINDKKFEERTSYKPNSPYSASKASSDHLVRAWNKTYKLPTVITNCTNNYGPFQFPEKLIPLTILKCLSHESIPIYGSGSQIRDWLYVEDHADALIRIFQRCDSGEIYNIGGNCEKTNLQVVEYICKMLDELSPSEKINNYSQLITFVEDRPGHDKRYAMNIGKIKRDYDWSPLETFESGMEKTIKWYLKNEDWILSITKKSYDLGRLGTYEE